jgi:diguanylate cyclase (GGDEF)-like protein
MNEDRAVLDEVTRRAEGKARTLFWGSLLLSVLIVLHSIYLSQRAGGALSIISSFLPVVLLWSMAMTAYAFFVLHDIARQRAERLAGGRTDPATGLFSLQYLHSCLEAERRHAIEAGRSAAVIYVDLVNLERVNNEFGHTVGDIVLKAMARLVAANARPGDIVGRVAGDEFLVIMPETSTEEAEAAVERIGGAVAGYDLNLGKRGTIDFIRCRFGVAMFPGEGDAEGIISVARAKLSDQPVGASVGGE